MSNDNFIIDITNQIEATVDIYPKLLDGSITNEELREAVEQKKIKRFGRWCSGK